MAVKSFVSPGVFTNEIDASFLGPGVGEIGAALLGTAPQGPAFVPVTVTSFSEYESFFGSLNEDHLLGYAARAYLKNSSTANIVRVLGPSGRTVNGSAVTPGWTADTIWAITGSDGTNMAVFALIEASASTDFKITDLTNDTFFVSASDGILGVGVTASFLTGSPDYIKKVLNTDPTQYSTYRYYLKEVYDYVTKKFTAGAAGYGSASYALTDNTFGYNSGSTTWIKSQLFGGGTEYNLFRIHTLGHGVAENGRFKVSVKNVRVSAAPSVSEFGRFDLEVRGFGDTDRIRNAVETFPNLTLDPTDPNYICRVIGDKFWFYNATDDKMIQYGNFENNSKLIRVEVTTGSYPDSALPWGFRGLAKPDLSAGGATSAIADLPLVKDLKDKETQAEAQSGMYWGVEFQLSGSVKSRLTKLPSMTGSDADFSLALVSGSSLSTLLYNTSNPATSKKAPGDSTTHTTLEPALAKFTLPIAFGADGFDLRLANPLANESQLASISQLGTQALRQAVDIISDPDFIDINLLAIPGIYSSKVADYAVNKIENRSDAFYVMDVTGSTVSAVVQEVKGRGFDTNYAGVYFPGVSVYDEINDVVKNLPASIPAVGAIAYNDRVGYPWFAPAGLNRGGLSRDTVGFDVTNLYPLNQTDRDKLYENRINPIARFPDVPGGVIWGQKTLQLKASALDRINVRRLLIKAKKVIASSVKFLVFEPNNATTQTRFKQLVNPILSDIQQKQGLEAFKVVCDASNNTPELIDRNQFNGKIFLIPTKSAEILTVDFIISPQGASFAE